MTGFLDIRGSGAGWVIYDGQNRLNAKVYSSYDKAAIAANTIERRRVRQLRTCLCCARPFVSQGPANRLCTVCKNTYA